MGDYDDQLDRALEELPEIQGDEERSAVPAPTVRTEGNVTVYENFQTTIDQLNRDEDLVVRVLQNELGTSAQIDESGRARFTGEFSQDRIRSAIEAFAEEYVRCSECGLPDTRLVEQQGTTVLRCEACGALSPVG